jgi:hypothetical protein
MKLIIEALSAVLIAGIFLTSMVFIGKRSDLLAYKKAYSDGYQARINYEHGH